MIRVDIRPVWTFRMGGEDHEFDFRMVPVLEGIERYGKLTRAAEHAGISYRHAWNLINQWTRLFGAPLVVMERGRGSSLTELGGNLLWAGRRAQARLAPELDSLASEFAHALNESLFTTDTLLSMHASHDFAVARLADIARDAGVCIDVQYRGSFDALAALRRGECDIAGFHVPDGRLGALMKRRYAECLDEAHVLIGFVTRRQGLMVRAGNPKQIVAVRDLMRGDVRMINRQRGSGTRALFEFLLTSEALDRSCIRGYDFEESTHSAVAALIAGNQADAGIGVEQAARQYGLGFVPFCGERYFLACKRERVDAPAIASLRRLLLGPELAAAVSGLAGYEPDSPGALIERDIAFAGS